MIEHMLKIGDLVWDDADGRWGYVALIGGEDVNELISYEKGTNYVVVLLMDTPNIADRCSEWETLAEDCYVAVKDVTFRGYTVCHEHYRDSIDYNYYCPDMEQNIYACELDE